MYYDFYAPFMRTTREDGETKDDDAKRRPYRGAPGGGDRAFPKKTGAAGRERIRFARRNPKHANRPAISENVQYNPKLPELSNQNARESSTRAAFIIHHMPTVLLTISPPRAWAALRMPAWGSAPWEAS